MMYILVYKRKKTLQTTLNRKQKPKRRLVTAEDLQHKKEAMLPE